MAGRERERGPGAVATTTATATATTTATATGVIGVALFNEMGTNPVPWTPDEVQRRRDANPFPGQFATPP